MYLPNFDEGNTSNSQVYNKFCQKIEPLSIDKYNNVTSYVISYYSLKNKRYEPVDTIRRNIIYWEDPTDVSKLTTTNFSNVKLPSEITMPDIINKPLGVMPPRDNIWATSYEEIVDFVEAIPSWKNTTPGGLRMNINGKTKMYCDNPGDFEMTYRNEPISFIQAITNENNDYLEYQYGFMRTKSEKIPKMNKSDRKEYFNKPKWTKRDALVFADAIAHDLLHYSGTKTYEITTENKMIYSLEGYDSKRNSKYKICVNDTESDYSVNFTYLVILYICSNKIHRFRHIEY